MILASTFLYPFLVDLPPFFFFFIFISIPLYRTAIAAIASTYTNVAGWLPGPQCGGWVVLKEQNQNKQGSHQSPQLIVFNCHNLLLHSVFPGDIYTLSCLEISFYGYIFFCMPCDVSRMSRALTKDTARGGL